jgi:predicted ribosome quality control (RQC) complex YloA/Tae2 family protein
MRIFQCLTSETTIRVGAIAKENDLLVKESHQDYIWCHLDNLPSPHVVIESSNPTSEELKQAFQLVKFFSKQKNSQQANIIYCRIRDLDRVDISKSGLVNIKKKPRRVSIKHDHRILKEFQLIFE